MIERLQEVGGRVTPGAVTEELNHSNPFYSNHAINGHGRPESISGCRGSLSIIPYSSRN